MRTLIFSLFAFTIAFANIVSAATSATVNSTVTPQNVSVSVSDGTVAYGTISLSSTKDTTTGGVNDSQTATNDGNVNTDFNIRGQDTAAWTLAGTAGADAYTHKFCTTTCDATPTWTALTTTNQTLVTTVAASGTQVFDLQIGTPTTSSSYTQQSADVIIQASAS